MIELIPPYVFAIPLLSCVPLWLAILVSATVWLVARWFLRWPARNVKVKPVRASRFSTELVPEKLDTIVIGSGKI